MALKVNLSGKNIEVTDMGSSKIGKIEPNEVYVENGINGSLHAIYFLSPSGAKAGFVQNFYGTDLTNYPFGYATIYGIQYKTFKMRRTANLYDINGNVVGSVAAGKRVAFRIDENNTGDTMNYLFAIVYAEKRAADNTGDRVDDNNSHGFVDTGLWSASGVNTINLISLIFMPALQRVFFF